MLCDYVDVGINCPWGPTKKKGYGREFGSGSDLFNSAAASFAYYEIGRGVGWVTDRSELVYDQENDRVLYSSFPLDQRVETQKQAYLQSVVDYNLEARPGTTGN